MKYRTPIISIFASSMALSLICVAPAYAGSGDTYLRPAVKVGQHLSDVFSKTVSIRGAGFDEYDKRIAGSANYTVTAVTSKGITFDSDYRYDGYSEGSGGYQVLQDGITNCFQGQCSVNDQTSGVLFNPYLWGDIPKDVQAGSTWKGTIAQPWEIGPSGSEQVQVLRLDAADGVITLSRAGTGSGPSSDDQAREKSGKPVVITKDGKQIEVSVIPGESHWSGLTTVCRGVIVSDEIMVERHVTLVTKTGEKFEAEQRTYTLLDLSSDAV
ncbi:MAG TPA: hypothetical protein VGO35_09530 [Gammaproteobacteria bacterium]|nr:hypothetical protein [Gammaproteobacteria bacterium]